MKFPNLFFIAFLTLSMWSGSLKAQLTVSDTLPTQDLIMTLFGSGVDVMLDTIVCDTNLAIREFDGSATNLDMSRGLLISTGLGDSAIGPNPSFGNQSFPLNVPGYPPLNALAGNNTFDACVIEFDIVPHCDSIGIRYVFASEEYNEFVNSFNDIFAFFISGPGISTPAPGQNIALVPGTSQPVSINNVNNGNSPGVSVGPCTNCQYFNDNVGGNELEFDGYTIPLVAGVRVIPCQTYHVTIAIADVLDDVVDSGVFLEVGGISCLSGSVDIQAQHVDVPDSSFVIESCQNSFGLFTFLIGQPLLIDTTFQFSVGGTATPGIDYIPIPTSVTIPAGNVTAILPVTVLSDQIIEGTETIEIYFRDSTACSTSALIDTTVLEIRDLPDNIISLADTMTCSGISIPVGISPAANQTYTWTPATFLSETDVSYPSVSPPDQNSYPYFLNYTLNIIGSGGVCLYEDSLQVEVLQGNYASVAVDTACFGNGTQFSAFSSGLPITSWEWMFGDGGSSTGSDPSYVYASSGLFAGYLLTDNADGCADTVNFQAQVDSLPLTGFISDTVCVGDSIQFIHTSDPSASLIWDLGDGTGTTTSMNPSHLYGSADTFYVQLKATDLNGCMDSLTQAAIVTEAPQADFVAPLVCQGNPTVFTNLSQPFDGFLFEWDFGDGSPVSTDASPAHTYIGFGTFNVRLIAISPGGCADTIVQPISVLESPEAVLVGDSVCLGDTIYFNDQTINSIPTFSLIDFGDQTTSSDQNPQHLYTAPGNYIYSFVVTHPNTGCVDTTSGVVWIYEPPSANFTADSVCQGRPNTFTNQSQAGSSSALSFEWDMGDNTTLTQTNLTYQYINAGTYNVQLSVTDGLGCQDSSTADALVRLRPQASFSAQNSCTDQALILENLSIAGDNEQLSFVWIDTLGSSYIGSDPTIQFMEAGTYPITLIVTDGEGCEDTTSNIFVLLLTPRVDFVVDNVCVGQSIQFANTSQSVSNATYLWNMDNGFQSQEESPTVVYNIPRMYNVSLIATSNEGCADTMMKPIQIFDPPTAVFAVDDPCEGEMSIFENTSQKGDGRRLEYIWTFDDGNQRSDLSPSHLYSAHGIYLPQLIVSDENGCSDTLTRKHVVWEKPSASFQLDNACQGATLNLSNQTTVAAPQTISKYVWDFGDGINSLQENPLKAYMQNGIFTVQLVAVSSEGCQDTTSQIIEIAPPPQASFSVTLGCFPDTMFYFNMSKSSLINNDPITAVNWSLGDGTVSGEMDMISKVYSRAGMYEVSITVQTEKGCEDTYKDYVRVADVLSAPIVSSDTVCFGDVATLTAQPPRGVTLVNWYRQLKDTIPFYSGLAYQIKDLTRNEKFWVEAVSSTGCTSQKVPIYAILHAPQPAVLLASDTLLNMPLALVELQVKGGTWVDYQWDLGDGTTSLSRSPVHEYRTKGKYEVRVKLTDENGCKQERSRLIEVRDYQRVWVPSAFSPNGDQVNDLLVIQSRRITSMQLEIFNRWSDQVFESQSLNPVWDGTHSRSGKKVLPGVYVYRLSYVDGNGHSQTDTGTITVTY